MEKILNGQKPSVSPRGDLIMPQPIKTPPKLDLEDEIVCVITSITSEIFVEQVKEVLLSNLSAEPELQQNLAKIGILPDQSIKVERIESVTFEGRWEAKVSFYYWSR